MAKFFISTWGSIVCLHVFVYAGGGGDVWGGLGVRVLELCVCVVCCVLCVVCCVLCVCRNVVMSEGVSIPFCGVLLADIQGQNNCSFHTKSCSVMLHKERFGPHFFEES